MADPEQPKKHDSFSVDSNDDEEETFVSYSTEKSEEIAAAEGRWVKRSKALVICALVAATSLCAYMTYRFTTQGEQDDFEKKFDDFGNEILDVSQEKARTVFATIEGMSTTITSLTLAMNQTWPFVTIPHYVARGSQLLDLSGSYYLGFAPLVPEHQRFAWENFTLENIGWANENLDGSPKDPNEDETPLDILPFIWGFGARGPERIPGPADPAYAPLWQVIPPSTGAINQDLFSVEGTDAVYEEAKKTRSPALSKIHQFGDPKSSSTSLPFSQIIAPIFRTLGRDAAAATTDLSAPLPSDVVALYTALLPWNLYFTNAIPGGTGGIFVVVRNTCDQEITFLVDGDDVTFVDWGDQHDVQFSNMELSKEFYVLRSHGDDDNSNNHNTACYYSLSAYPSAEFEAQTKTSDPVIYTIAVVLIFFLTSLVFIVYDCFVQRRDVVIMDTAVNSNAIVHSLFPAQVRDRLKAETIRRNNTICKANHKMNSGALGISSQQKQGAMIEILEADKAALLKSKPIADLFPAATVMFADIQGFTAWASAREPAQVFVLLEQIYGTFDINAKWLGIFKVETIGDCYVAAAGLPTPRADHAVVMTRFARMCLNDMIQVVHALEIMLGPETADLCMRFGLHSGPVTGGVLRGSKSRFQLFGDTINMAARIESTGMQNRIHISQDTADQLVALGRGGWITPRHDPAFIKGKGEVQTYWINGAPKASSTTSSKSVGSVDRPKVFTLKKQKSSTYGSKRPDSKSKRLVNWNVEVLQQLLQRIVAMRIGGRGGKSHQSRGELVSPDVPLNSSVELVDTHEEDVYALDEVKAIIELPDKATKCTIDPTTVCLDPQVTSQLYDFVQQISTMYHDDNPFHCFEHASHVTQSVIKLLSRVVTPDSINFDDMAYVKKHGTTMQMHEYTHGIASDPLTQFACAFSALIHDVEHEGVPNAVLVKEQSDLATKYKNKSVAEQNSVNIAWNLLQQSDFSALRNCIHATAEEEARFRQLVVNSVMATDIADKELGALRKARWNKAFDTDKKAADVKDESARVAANRKATIVIEHLIQASDVSHTMQHWHVYLKWNERLFREMYSAFLEGRLESDPSKGWYEGELGFFDFYLIPLGKKLKECCVFGVASDEYLNYATANRREWESKGREVVAGYLERYHSVTNDQGLDGVAEEVHGE